MTNEQVKMLVDALLGLAHEEDGEVASLGETECRRSLVGVLQYIGNAVVAVSVSLDHVAEALSGRINSELN